jgi:hypothetical protein
VRRSATKLEVRGRSRKLVDQVADYLLAHAELLQSRSVPARRAAHRQRRRRRGMSMTKKRSWPFVTRRDQDETAALLRVSSGETAVLWETDTRGYSGALSSAPHKTILLVADQRVAGPDTAYETVAARLAL